MKQNTIIIITVIAVIIGFIALFQTGMLSVTGSNDVEIPYSCEMPIDCEKAMIADGAADQQAINIFKNDYDLICRNSQCVGVLK